MRRVPVMASADIHSTSGSNRVSDGTKPKRGRSGIRSPHVPLLSVGMNSRPGPEGGCPLIEELAAIAFLIYTAFLAAHPNAGASRSIAAHRFSRNALIRCGNRSFAEWVATRLS